MLISRVTPARVRATARCASVALLAVQPTAASAQSVSAAEPLDEIIVTARKKAESLLDVPMSVQVLAGSLIDTSNKSTLLDLQFEMPGLVVTNAGMFGGGVALRGVTNQGGGSIAVATHLDGVPLGNSRLAMARVFDVERIEVLKGPQGTLYGGNSTGGSINIHNRRPHESQAASVEFGVGSFGLQRADGHVNLPLGRSATRLAVAAADSDGYIRNSVDGREFAQDDFVAARLSWLFEPSDALSLIARYQHVDDSGGLTELWMPRPDYLPDPDDPYLTTVTHPDPYLDIVSDNANVVIEYDFGELALHSVTGYARSRIDNIDDCAGVPGLRGCVRTALPNTYEQWSQELRLQSSGSTRIEWLAGLFYSNGDDETNYYLHIPAFGPAPRYDQHTRDQVRTVAAFGNATWRVGGAWRVTAGARLGRDRSHLTTFGSGVLDNAVPVSGTDSWSGVAWRLGADYTVGQSALVFASVATGYKSGGFMPNVLPNGELDDYRPENVIAFEAGVNIAARDGRARLRAAAFHNDFEDLQVLTTVAGEGGSFTAVTDNASRARIYGLDLEAAASAGERWSFSVGAVWLPERRYLEFITADSALDVSGNYLIRAPEWSTTAAVEYRRPVARGTVTARLDGSYRSLIYFTRDNAVEESQDAFGIANLYLRFDAPTQNWYLYVSGKNLTDETYYTQVFLQSAVGMPRSWEAGFGWRH